MNTTQQELSQRQQAFTALQQAHRALSDQLQAREAEVRQAAQEKEALQVHVVDLEGRLNQQRTDLTAQLQRLRSNGRRLKHRWRAVKTS